MTPKVKFVLTAGLVALAAMGPVHAAAQDSPRLMYRVRLVPASAPRGGSDWVAHQAQELSVDFGQRFVPILPDGAFRMLAARAAAGSMPEGTVDELRAWVRVEFTGEQAVAALERISRDLRVDRIEPVPVARTAGLSPDDPLLVNQGPWLDLVGLPAAWASGEVPAPASVKVAIIDGGTDWEHPDLLANVASNPGEVPDDGIDQDGNGFVDDVHGWNFPANSPDPAPLAGQDFNARHGTHVAGTVGAVLGNGMGVAGTAANPELILVNAAHPEIDGGIAYGYEGILYALTRGAQVINCSWRTVRVVSGQILDAPYSEFEASVLRLARESGALVVAAVGNDTAEGLWTTPAGYDDAFAVAATNFTEAVPWPAGNRASWVDLYAPGQSVVSTFPRSQPTHLGPYGLLSGTSMAAAITSGVAAYVASQRPGWTSEQLRLRLRWTAADMPDLEGLRLLRADVAMLDEQRTDIALRMEGAADEDGDGLIEGNETIDLRFTAQSGFESQAGVRIEAWTDDEWLVPLITALGLPRVPFDQVLEVRRGLRFWVHPKTPPGHVARVQIRAISEGNPGPPVSGVLVLRPMSARIANQQLSVAASANGMLGETTIVVSEDPVDHALARAGEDFGFLRRAGLILAAGPDRLSHALVPRGPGISARDYFPLEDGLNRNPVPGGSELVLRYSDLNVAGTLGVTITQRVSLAEAPPGDDFAIIEYDIVPLDQPVEDLRFGLALDWSMPSAALAGPVGYVAERLIEITDGLGVEAVEPQVGAAVAGARILGSPAAVGRAGLGQWQTDEPGWNLAGDPSASPTDADLWSLMQPGRDDSLDRTGDRVGILSSAVGRIDPGESRRVAVAFAIANDRAALEATLDRARVTWETGRVGLTPESMSTGFISFSSNPFRSSTEASYVLTESGPVRIDVFDLRGRRVRTLVDGVREVGVHRADWDGRDQRGVPVASGVYLVRLQAGGTDTSQAITRVR